MLATAKVVAVDNGQTPTNSDSGTDRCGSEPTLIPRKCGRHLVEIPRRVRHCNTFWTGVPVIFTGKRRFFLGSQRLCCSSLESIQSGNSGRLPRELTASAVNPSKLCGQYTAAHRWTPKLRLWAPAFRWLFYVGRLGFVREGPAAAPPVCALVGRMSEPFIVYILRCDPLPEAKKYEILRAWPSLNAPLTPTRSRLSRAETCGFSAHKDLRFVDSSSLAKQLKKRIDRYRQRWGWPAGTTEITSY